MGAERKAEDTGSKGLIECRARFIRDPVEKLRYLRRAAGEPVPARKRREWSSCRRLSPALIVVLLLVPIPTVSDVPMFRGLEGSPPVTTDTAPAEPVSRVWLVDQKDEFELYSNGLRIENGHVVTGEPRPYPVLDRETLELRGWRSGLVGIVYHTTESHLAPFDPSHNGKLQRVGEWLLALVQRNGSYHFVIDRFGRVHRIVRETDSANHAGYSVWADDQWVYVNLNPSFLGIAFETQSGPGSTGAEVTAAQVHTARILTEMLRSKYDIPAANCVTHAQVSVNPWNMRIGNHTDWAVNFPFSELGLGDNYTLSVPALSVFGFRYDEDFVKATEAPLWKGMALGEDQFRRQAASKGISVAGHRVGVKKLYRGIIEAIEEAAASKEKKS
jgi:hypothetical protein